MVWWQETRSRLTCIAADSPSSKCAVERGGVYLNMCVLSMHTIGEQLLLTFYSTEIWYTTEAHHKKKKKPHMSALLERWSQTHAHTRVRVSTCTLLAHAYKRGGFRLPPNNRCKLIRGSLRVEVKEEWIPQYCHVCICAAAGNAAYKVERKASFWQMICCVHSASAQEDTTMKAK